MKNLFTLFVILFVITGNITAQTWTEQTNNDADTIYTVIQSIERFEELLKQYADFYSYYSVLFFPKEELDIITKNSPKTGLFLLKMSIRSDAPKLRADYLKNIGVEQSPCLLRVDPEKGSFMVVFYNDPNMEEITDGLRLFTNYSALFKFYKSIFK